MNTVTPSGWYILQGHPGFAHYIHRDMVCCGIECSRWRVCNAPENKVPRCEICKAIFDYLPPEALIVDGPPPLTQEG